MSASRVALGSGRGALCPYVLVGALLLAPWTVARADSELAIPESCGTREELARELDTLLPDQPHPDVRMQPDDEEGYLLEVDLPSGLRRLYDVDCRSLFRAAVVIAGLEGARPAPAPPAAPPPPPRNTEPDEVIPALRPVPTPEPAYYMPYVWAALGYGLVPAEDAVVGLGIAARHGWLAGRIVFAYATPRTHVEAGQSLRIQALSASATVELPVTDWFHPGVGLDYHALHGEGEAVARARDDWATLLTLHASLVLRIARLGPVQLEGVVRGQYAPQPARFRLSDRSTVYSSAQFGLQAGLALGVPLP